jgi:DNA-binding transcriptional LysR family regulator
MRRAASWRGLELFSQVVEAGSITAAADRLGVSKSSVSTQVTALEAALGVRLLSRSKAGVRLTEPGRRMYEHARRLLMQVDTALEDVRAEESSPTGTLRISMPAGIADSILVPVLGRFLQRYPKIRLDVQATDSLLELRESGIDVALRFGWVRDGDFVAKRICQFPEVICASPEYLSVSAAIHSPRDLANHRWIGFTGFGGVQQTIELRDHSGRRRRVTVECRVRTSNAPSQKFWALAGAGLTRLPRFVVSDELQSGRLVSVLDGFELDGPSLYAIHLADRYKPAVVKALLGFLENALSAGLENAVSA